jgi:hypothetical protein
MTRITKYKVSATIAAGATTASAYSVPVRGKILAVGINYPANTCTVDLDSDGEAAAQKIVDLAAASTDVVIYPRVASQDITGTDVTFDGTNEIYEPFIVYGRVKLSLATGTAGDTVSVDIVVEEN